MTKGKVMISDLKSRTLSLFRRSSASSTHSASSVQSSDQNERSVNDSPAQLRKRPLSARSRSSLTVPRLKPGAVAKPVREEEGEDRDEIDGHNRQGEPQSQPQSGPRQSTTTVHHKKDDTDNDRSNIAATPAIQVSGNRQKQQAISSPLPLPTPEPSPLEKPETRDDSVAPQLSVQPSSPDEETSTGVHKPTPVTSDAGAAPTTTAAAAATAAAKGRIARQQRSLQLDLGGRPRAPSTGRRSLLDSHPRSPLYQSVAVERSGGDGTEAVGSDQATSQSGQPGSRPSQDHEPSDYFSSVPSTPRNPRTPPIMAHSPSRYPQQYMQQPQQQQPRRRKIWVKRPGASATMVAINEDDMVDDARDMILRKYANSLGKSFDSPDVTIRIRPREQPVSSSQRSSSAQLTPSPLLDERALRPDETLSRTIDVYFPGGQSLEEALIIDTPTPTNPKSRRTPRHSPGVHSSHYYASQNEDMRPNESDKDYFPPMVLTQPATGPMVSGAPSPRILGSVPLVASGGHPHSIAVLNGAQLPTLPSPGVIGRDGGSGPGPPEGGKRRIGEHRRPKFARQHTSSPTIVQHPDSRQTMSSGTMSQAPALPTPPHPATQNMPTTRISTPPPPRISSPRPKAKRSKKPSMSGSISGLMSPHSSGLLASVPPINVLVVEDNNVNLKLLEAFLKRLKVRSHSAKDGREAVAKWRQGGFHLVLMDIQLPLMNGLEATKEIRRLERVNGVGAFVKTEEEFKMEHGEKRPEVSKEDSQETVTVEDADKETEKNRIGKKELFKSPVIIVALTASSLHSDRSEALAAGCNDFLTKPVNLTWLERKLKEWGCMQALIDFDGWRQWKDFQSPNAVGPSPKVAQTPLKKGQLSNSSPSNTASDGIKASSHHTRSPTSGSGKNAFLTSKSAALQELNAHNESNESTATLDSMTSDDADSFDTAIPAPNPRSRQSTISSLSPTAVGPSVNVQSPTPRQSTDAGVPRIETIVESEGTAHPNPAFT